MKYTFRAAKPDDIENVFLLYKKRICWMEEKNIRQWNTTGYLEAYPVDYYARQQSLGNLYVLTESSTIIGAVVLLQEDNRWVDKADMPAFYIHNLVTDPKVTGIGKRILMESERIALQEGKAVIRLDCAEDNMFLNNYYESLGYKMAGTCQDGSYFGNRREKTLLEKDR